MRLHRYHASRLRFGRLATRRVHACERALDHGDADGEVSVKLSSTQSAVLIDIRNDGEPIAPASMPTLFEPLKRREGVVGRRMHGSSGLGLGLFIADQIVAAHGGEIRVTSTKEAGTTFSVHLPRRV